MNIEEELNGMFLNWHPTGSNYICNPPVTDTDIDFVCFDFFVNPWQKQWTLTNADEDGMYEGCERMFDTFRKGKYNLIVAKTVDFYNKFVQATEAAKILNLTDKQDRIDLFQKVLYRKG